MKQITLLVFILSGFIWGQTSPYCNTEVAHFGGNAGSEINLTMQNTGANTFKITAAASDISLLFIVPPITGNPTITEDTSVSGEISQTLEWAGSPPSNVEFPFLQWERTSTGGARWQLNESPSVSVPFAATCAGPAEDDVTLNDLQVDNTTVDDFGPATTTYNIGVESATPVPQITLVSTTNPNAVVGTISQATSVPGTATFDVTGEDNITVQTYTINFSISIPGTELIGNGGFETGDFTDWQQFESAANQQTVSNTNPSEGTFSVNINNTTPGSSSAIKSANRGIGIVNGEDEVTIKFDMRGSLGVGGVVFAELFSEIDGGGTSKSEILGGGPIFPNADPNVWTSFEFTTTVGVNVSAGISLQLAGVTGGDPASNANVWFDNVSLVSNDEVLGTEVFVQSTALSVSPNPSAYSWNITTVENARMTSIVVFNLLGKEVIRLEPNSNHITLPGSNLKSGLYLARVVTTEGSQTIKLIKE